MPDRESPWVHPRGQVPLFANKSGEGADRTMGRRTRTVWQFSRNKLFGSSSFWCLFCGESGRMFFESFFFFPRSFQRFAQTRSPPLDGLKELECHCRSQERNSPANTKGMKQHDKHLATKSLRIFYSENFERSFKVNRKNFYIYENHLFWEASRILNSRDWPPSSIPRLSISVACRSHQKARSSPGCRGPDPAICDESHRTVREAQGLGLAG